MRVLILGGTSFLGRHLVDALLARGHNVTLFNRGRTAPGLFPQVEQLHGERDGRLAALEAASRTARWDAAIDTSGYVPRVVAASCRLLHDCCDHYLFTSSISVYADFSQPGLAEDATVASLDDLSSEDVASHYGALKAACEEMVRREFGANALVVRPGLIVGPCDPTDRFTYWPVRASQGGEMLAPAPADAALQFIDARDLAAWMVSLLERQVAGTFNATGPASPLRWGEFIEACIRAGGANARAVWVAPEFLLDQGVSPWSELPLWLGGEQAGMMQIDVRRAFAQGLAVRGVEDIVADTLAWARREGPAAGRREAKAGMSRQREAALLALTGGAPAAGRAIASR